MLEIRIGIASGSKKGVTGVSVVVIMSYIS